jgi:hypothetical protein
VSGPWEECQKRIRVLSVAPERRVWYKGRLCKTASVGAYLLRRKTMSTVFRVLVAVTVALGAFLSPVMGAEDHIMVTPNDLKWADVPSLPHLRQDTIGFTG